MHVRFGGPEVSSYELQSLLGTDKHSSVPTSLDDVKALIADASVRMKAVPPRSVHGRTELADGIGSTLLEVFDVAEAAGAAASQRFIADRALSLSGVDADELKLGSARPPKGFSKKLMALRALHLSPAISVMSQLRRRLRPRADGLTWPKRISSGAAASRPR